MIEKKINRRVQYTLEALHNALIDLAAEKPLNSITVTDICARADINRSTFYLHYKDIRDLLNEIEEDILAQMDVVMTQNRDDALLQVLGKIKDEPRTIRLLRTLMGENGDPQFLRRFERQAYRIFQCGWDKHLSHVDPRFKRYIYSYIIGGTVAAIGEWIYNSEPKMDTEDLANVLKSLIDCGISKMSSDLRNEDFSQSTE